MSHFPGSNEFISRIHFQIHFLLLLLDWVNQDLNTIQGNNFQKHNDQERSHQVLLSIVPWSEILGSSQNHVLVWLS